MTIIHIETMEVLSNYSRLLGYLANVYHQEIGEKQLDHLCSIAYMQDFGESDIETGTGLLWNYLQHSDGTTLNNLAVDFARVFLGVGPKPEYAAIPYESVFTSQRGLLMQESRDEMIRLLNKEQLKPNSSFFIQEDHISCEFEYAAYLLEKMGTKLENGEQEIALVYLAKASRFFDKHLTEWVPAFCNRVFNGAATDFYKGLALITKGFILVVHEYLVKLVDEWTTGCNAILAAKEWEVLCSLTNQ